MGLIPHISGNRVYLDTRLFIFFIEGVAPYVHELTPLFSAIDAGTYEAVTGEITVAECLVKPKRDRNEGLLRAFGQALQNLSF